MPPLALGAIAALCIGISDTFGRASSKRASSVSHVSTQMFVGIFASVPLLFLFDSSLRMGDALMGAMSGICVGIGLSIVYQAMADSSSAIAAPTAGVIAAILPLLFDVVVRDASLSARAGLGCLLAIAALSIVSYNPSLGSDAIRNGLGKAVIGGVFFGATIIFLGDTSEGSGVWPSLIQRIVAFLSMIPIAARAKVPLFLPENVRTLGVLGGITGALGMGAFAVGSQQGDLGTVSVVAATYPVVIVVLATLFDDDDIHWWQAFGIAGAIAGTALIAWG